MVKTLLHTHKSLKHSSLLLLLFFSYLVNAQQVIELEDGIEEFAFQGEYLKILEDKERKWSIREVASETMQDKFVLNKKPYAFNENPSSGYWVKFKVKNSTTEGKHFLFECYSPHTNDFRLYVPDGKGGYKLKQSGHAREFYNREIINKNLVLDLPVHDTTKVHTFYAYVYSKGHTGFDFRIKTVNYFTFYSTNEYYLLGLYYGILLIMAIYNLLLYFSLREKVYLFFVFYIISGILTTITDDGLGYQYLWYKTSELNSILGHHLAPLMLLGFFVFYTRSFLQLKENFPKWDWLIVRVLAFYIIYYVIHHFILKTIFPDLPYFRFMNVLPYALISVISIVCFTKEYRPAKFFVLGSLWITFSIAIIQLRANGTIEGNIFTVYSLNYGLVVDVLLFSLALSERIKFIKVREQEAQHKVIETLQKNERLKDKVNRELEQKVAERTKELHEANKELLEANQKLKEITEKANQMSSKLDMDNWQLQKSMKESIKARVNDQEVSFAEFSKIFPDDNACFKYLSELKWNENNPYVCRKCGNTKYTNGVKPFSRKCTRCAYPESVTAYTLFHGLRFPINKAFYMTYLVQKKPKITLGDLSEILDLRRNTCWNFKKKIIEAMENYQRDNKNKEIQAWEEVIFSA